MECICYTSSLFYIWIDVFENAAVVYLLDLDDSCWGDKGLGRSTHLTQKRYLSVNHRITFKFEYWGSWNNSWNFTWNVLQLLARRKGSIYKRLRYYSSTVQFGHKWCCVKCTEKIINNSNSNWSSGVAILNQWIGMIKSTDWTLCLRVIHII